MFPIQDQIPVAARRHLESQFSLAIAMSGKTLDGIEACTNLNITAFKALMGEAAGNAQEVLEAQNPQQLFNLFVQQVQPGLAKSLAYSRHLAGIGAGLRAEYVRVAESQAGVFSRAALALVDEMARKGPAGSGEFAALLQSAVENGGKAYEQFARGSAAAGEAIQANLDAAWRAQASVAA